MKYESFRAAWEEALRESKLPLLGLYAEETLDLRSLARRYEVIVEPLGGQDAQPFFVTATLSWIWDALLTARAQGPEEELLTTVLGRCAIEDPETERPYLRVDIKLTASLPYGKAIRMPSTKAWTSWVRETLGRLERIEPLLPDEVARENQAGLLEVLAWHEPPKVEATCDETGELRLESVSISAGQLVDLPRVFDDSDREPDDGPEEELQDLFHRVRAALSAWMQALDHLRR